MLLLAKFPLFYTPLSDDEFSRVTSSPETAELYVDFVTVLQGLVVPLSNRSYSCPVFPIEMANLTCERIIADVENRDSGVGDKMKWNRDVAAYLHQSPVPTTTTDIEAMAWLANSFMDRALEEFDKFRKFEGIA